MDPRRSKWGPWLALRMVHGVGNVSGQILVRAFGGAPQVFEASPAALRAAGARRNVCDAVRRFDRWGEVAVQLRRIEQCGARLVTWLDGEYPENLRQIHDPPLYLIVRGALLDGDRRAVAVVGTRLASAYGRQAAARISRDLAGFGVTVVSGLARGVDGEAHAAALRAGGRTVAVLGCGVDITYPREHARLRDAIVGAGAVVSEFLMGTAPEAENFPMRNRVISGLSIGTLVIEAAERSGSLITARLALEQGREVFALPGPVGPRTQGTHRLLREGATLVESAEDIVREIAPWILAERRLAPQPEPEGLDAAVFACLSDTGVHVDAIVQKTGLDVGGVLEVLLRLELMGLIVQLPGKYFIRAGGAARQ